MTNCLRRVMIVIIAILEKFRRSVTQQEPRRLRTRSKRRSIWVRKWIHRRTTHLRGSINLAHVELRPENESDFEEFFRMRHELFDRLLDVVSPFIQRRDTNMRQCISPKERLSITLRFLATGESFRSLEFSTRIPACTISRIIPETCRVLYEVLRGEYMQIPTTSEDWQEVADDFSLMWNVPNCIGAIDGRHIVFKKAEKDGAIYRNYKGTDSIVLLGLVDAHYRFTYINVGVNGRVSDGGVFRDSDLARHLQDPQNPLNIPENKPLPRMINPVPHVILADNAFPLQTNILKPFPVANLNHDQRIFNYRVSRGRRIVENAFGILASRFRVLLSSIYLPVESVTIITQACCALHNFLASENGLFQRGITDFRDDINNMLNPMLYDDAVAAPVYNATDIRSEFMQYFNTVGQLPWQENVI